ARVVFLRSTLMILSFFSSRGWESWDVEHRPLLPERMPVRIDDDLRFEDGPGSPRPATAVNRWLRAVPSTGCPAPSAWGASAGTGREMRVNLAVRRTPKPHVTITGRLSIWSRTSPGCS